MAHSGMTIDPGNGKLIMPVALVDPASGAPAGGGSSASSGAIAAAGSLSAPIDCGAQHLAAVLVPSGWTAAVLTFQGSADGLAWADVYDDQGNEATAQAAASRFVAFDVLATVLAAFRFVKVRSGTGASPVAQAAGAALSVLLRG